MKRDMISSRRYLGPLLALLFLLTACSQSVAARWQKQYDLGQKYLQELDYEQALLAFDTAIDIDADRGEAYIGRGDVYVALAAQGSQQSAASYENYQHARSDYEQGIASLGLSWETVDKLCDVYQQQGDTQALCDLLEQAREALGDSDDLDLRVEHYGLSRDESGAIEEVDWGAKKYEMFDERNVWLRARNYYTENNFLPLEAYESALRPKIEEIKQILEHVEDKEDMEFFGHYLESIYYMLGDMDSVRETRRYLYEQTGDEEYDPDGYTFEAMGGIEIEYYNGYGQKIRSVRSTYGSDETLYEYNERGQITAQTDIYGSDSYRYENTYDAQGRIATNDPVEWNTYSGCPARRYTYEGNRVREQCDTIWPDGTVDAAGDSVYELDEFGMRVYFWYYFEDGTLSQEGVY